MGSIFYFLLVIFIFSFVCSYLKSLKKPDVQAATKLRMSVIRYRKYRKLYDEHQKIMDKYGIESKESIEYSISILPKIKNMNEWRRYQDYRYKESLDVIKNKFNEILK